MGRSKKWDTRALGARVSHFLIVFSTLITLKSLMTLLAALSRYFKHQDACGYARVE